MEHYVVKKLIKGTVFYKVPGENRERTWKGDDARLKIPFTELEVCVYDPDVKKLFEKGYLYIEDKDCRIALGLEDADETTNANNKLVYDKNKIVPLLYDDSFLAFKKKVENLADGSLEIMIQTAIESGKQLSFEKSDYIRKKFHVDVEAIQRAKREEQTTKEE